MEAVQTSEASYDGGIVYLSNTRLLLLRIQKVPVSNLGSENGYPEVSSGFS